MEDKQQIKAQQAINSGTLNQKNIVVNQAQDKHIQVKHGDAYQIIFQQDNKILNVDFDVIAKKVGDDLTLLLDDSTTVVFDDYFSICVDLSCVVSLPSAGALYHVIGNQSVVLVDGTEVVYVYGDKSILQGIAFGEDELLQFLNQSYVSPDSSWSLSTLGAGALGALGLASGSFSSDSTTFTISGSISAGQVFDVSGYTIEVYNKNGEILKTTTSFKDDGSFTIKFNKAYTGNILIRLKDENSDADYLDEGTGQNKDLSVDLRAITSSNGNDMTVNINMLTEIATRQLFQDSSNADTDLSDFTSTEISAANGNIATAFGLNGDIITTKPALVNTKKDDDFTNVDATEDEQALGYALAAISGMETRNRNNDVRKSTNEVLNELANGITNDKLNQDVANDLIAGAEKSNEQSENADIDANFINSFESQIGNINISDDTTYSASGDTDDNYITRVLSQDITATLTQALNNEKLWGSVDSGDSWTDITSFVATKTLAISWSVDLEEGENSIQFAITDNTATSPTFNNINGRIAVQHYTLDSTAPLFSSIEKITDSRGKIHSGDTTKDTSVTMKILLEGSKAEKGDIVQINDGNSQFGSTFELTADNITNNYINVTLDLTTIGNNNDKEYTFSVKIIDAAGNAGSFSQTYILTLDFSVEKLGLALQEDTGLHASDNITNHNTLVISNIEEGAKVEYLLDGGSVWRVIPNAITEKDTTTIVLESGIYVAGQIKVRQTDKAGNVSVETSNKEWDIDTTSAVYEEDDDLDFIRIFEDDSDVVKESQITLTFDEDIIKPATFDNESFTISIDGNNQIIDRVEINGEKVLIYILGNVISASAEISIAYNQSDNTKALQDKAGNSIGNIVSKTYSVDNISPSKPTISSIVDDIGDVTGEVQDNAITDDNYLSVIVDISGIGVIAGDTLFFYNKGKKLTGFFEISSQDIINGSKTVSLNLDGSADGKVYELGVKIIDKSGNVSDMSDLKHFTVDAKVGTPSVALIDTGTSTSDYVTSITSVEVSNIERDATWEYSLNGGEDWTAGNSGSPSDTSDTKYSFSLAENTIYEARDIIVRQTDKAGNTATFKINYKVIVDSIAPEYQLTEGSGNTIILIFSEDLYFINTTSSAAIDAFTIENNKVTRVKTNDNKVYLSVRDTVDDVSAIEISYVRPNSDNFHLKDRAGNVVDNLKIGTKDADASLIGTSSSDTFIGGLGNDILTGNGGIDTFDYNAITDGNDTITDFKIGSGGDKLDLKDLLSYTSSEDLNHYIQVSHSGTTTTLNIDANGSDSSGSGGTFVSDISITLQNTGSVAITLSDLQADNLIVL